MPPRRPLLAAVALGSVLVLTGCGSQPPLSPPTGVDGLVVPTPSPDPDDFVADVDNPWLPLEPGEVWSYDVTGVPGATRVTYRVGSQPVTVAGVATTPVVGGGSTLYFAQDRAGNVWWLGRDGADGAGAWRAGVDGAEAGLAMPAAPRVGDGFRTGYAPGTAEAVATVLSVDDGLLLEVADPVAGTTRQELYERGVGLARATDVEGGDATYRLVGGPR